MPNDFIHGDLPVQNRRRRLMTNAVPSIFPWKPVKKRQSLISQKAMQPLQADCLEQSSCLVTDHESYESVSMLNNSVEVESSCEFSNVEDSVSAKIYFMYLAKTKKIIILQTKKSCQIAFFRRLLDENNGNPVVEERTPLYSFL